MAISQLSLRIVTALVLLVVAVAAHGMAQDLMRQYNKLAVQPSAELMHLGRDCFARHQADSALVCFTIVANRYSEHMSQADKELVGYHVYRNGERITDLPVTDTTWVDDIVDEEAVYHVTVVYDLGESEPSNSAMVSFTGIEAVSVDPQQTPVYDLAGRRVTHLQPGQVYVTRGRKFVNK